MATEKELIDAVRNSLESEGELSRMKAEMRMKVMKLLEGSRKSDKSNQPMSPHEVLILNEVIREYLDWMGYKYTLNVFTAESDLSKNPLDRTIIIRELGTVDSEKTRKLPLLFCLLETIKEIQSA